MKFLDTILYRTWQFYKALFPDLDLQLWQEIKKKVDPKLVPLLEGLGKAEKSHTLRVLKLIEEDKDLPKELKTELSEFAIIHDIGKSITKPTLLFKVCKVLFRLSSDAHCIAGSRAVWHITHNKKQAIRILRHHVCPNQDSFLLHFQKYDNQA